MRALRSTHLRNECLISVTSIAHFINGVRRSFIFSKASAEREHFLQVCLPRLIHTLFGSSAARMRSIFHICHAVCLRSLQAGIHQLPLAVLAESCYVLELSIKRWILMRISKNVQWEPTESLKLSRLHIAIKTFAGRVAPSRAVLSGLSATDSFKGEGFTRALNW